jgi:hypothetical protein
VVGIAPASLAGVAIRNHTNEGTASMLPLGKASYNRPFRTKVRVVNGSSATRFLHLISSCCTLSPLSAGRLSENPFLHDNAHWARLRVILTCQRTRGYAPWQSSANGHTI